MLKNKFDCIIMANGEFPSSPLALSFLKDAPYIIACDGALEKLQNNGFRADCAVGDLDSLDENIKKQFASIIQLNSEQETNDLSKSIKFAQNKGFHDIVILGATGLREDHTLGNISLLVNYINIFDSVRLVSDYGMFIPIRKDTTFKCTPGQQISLFALPPLCPISVRGLCYPISHRTLSQWWEGTLNEAAGQEFSVILEGEGSVLVYMRHI